MQCLAACRWGPRQPTRLSNSVSELFGLAGLAIGAGLGGILTSSFDLETPWLVGGMVFAICALVAAPDPRNWEKTSADL